jgi:hypothetical protein
MRVHGRQPDQISPRIARSAKNPNFDFHIISKLC